MEHILPYLLLVIGFAALIKGADFFVDGSSSIAKKGNSDIALGNIVGSNIFNVLFILGTTVLIRPINIDAYALIDQIVLLVTSVALAIAAATGKKLSRIEGIVFLLLYGGYATYLFIR